MTGLDEEAWNRSPGKQRLWPSGSALRPLPLLPQSLTVAPGLLQGRGRVCEFGGGRPRGDGRVRVQALGHLVADEVHEALEGLLHVDVVLGAGLEELETFGGGGGAGQGTQSDLSRFGGTLIEHFCKCCEGPSEGH